jgi:hypothetical protein
MNQFGGCPGSRMMNFKRPPEVQPPAVEGAVPSQLRQWPIQLHLISPMAPYYQDADVLLTADCVAYALGNFHNSYLSGHSLAIACPKLDEGQDVYRDKIKAWFDTAKIKSLTVLIMEVPCCMGLLQLAKQAAAEAQRQVPVKFVVVGVQGDVLREESVQAGA